MFFSSGGEEMSHNFFRKAAALVPHVTIHPSQVKDSNHERRVVRMLDNSMLNLPEEQIPDRTPHVNNNLWRYPASGQFTTIFQNGGQVTIKILRATGTGYTKKVWLRMKLTNSSAVLNVAALPIAFWINKIEWQTPSGEVISTIDGTMSYLLKVINTSKEDWDFLTKIINAGKDYLLSPNFFEPLEQREIFYELPAAFLEVSDYLIPSLDADLDLLVTFQASTLFQYAPDATFTTTPVIQLTEFSLDVLMDQMDPSDLNHHKMLWRKNQPDFIYPFLRHQSWTQTFTANQRYTFNTSGIRGDVVFALFGLRPPNTATGGIKNQLNFQQISQYQLQDSEGNGVSGQQFEADIFSREVLYPMRFLGNASQRMFLYHLLFGSADYTAISLINIGHKAGAYTFDTHDNLIIDTPPAGTNEVITFTPNAAATAGTWTIFWKTPFGSSLSEPLGFNATNAEVQAEMDKMEFFPGTFTVTGPAFNVGGARTWTAGGILGNKPLLRDEYQITILSNMTGGGPIPITLFRTLVTPGVFGITSGSSYTLDFWAWTTSIMHCDNRGQMKVRHS